jgi:NAD(P)-dependent dehydrogenase (short-subunit alcohol dehydrogenase family)
MSRPSHTIRETSSGPLQAGGGVSDGRIIITGSIFADHVPRPGSAVYPMTKAAVAELTRGLARELGPRAVTVNVIQPGPTATDTNPDYPIKFVAGGTAAPASADGPLVVAAIYCRFRGSAPGPLETFCLGRANAPDRSLTCPFACHQGAHRLAGQGVDEGHREAPLTREGCARVAGCGRGAINPAR